MTYWCCIISLVYYCDWTPMSYYDTYCHRFLSFRFIHIFQKTEPGPCGRGFISSQLSTNVCWALANEERVSVRDQCVIRSVCAGDTQTVSCSSRYTNWYIPAEPDSYYSHVKFTSLKKGVIFFMHCVISSINSSLFN